MWRLILPALLIASLGACAHGEAFEGGVFRKDGVTVHLGPLPPDWKRVDVDGADLSFRDDVHEGSVLFDVRCGRRDDDAPLSVLTEHLLMGTTEREFETQETISFDAREAMHSVLRAKLDGVPMRYEIYVMKKDGCVYDIVYVAPPERFAEGANNFERFALGMHALSSPRAIGSRHGGAPSSNDP